MAFGGIGYCIYAISLLASVHAHVDGFNIFAGALLGICAGLLWTAQGTIMVSYPYEGDKGKYFGIFWAVFNFGAVLGALVSLIPFFCTFCVIKFIYSLFRSFRLFCFFSFEVSGVKKTSFQALQINVRRSQTNRF